MSVLGRLRRRLARGLPWIAGTLIGLAVVGFLFAWSGLYDVSSSAGHWSVTEAVLEFGLDSAVRTQSMGIEPPPLDRSDWVALGANHFASGCAPCHGAPGHPRNPITLAMLPRPPPLGEAATKWQTRELYWIVRHGLKYTGMPAWAAEQRGDEVWPVVAFLEALPQLSAADFDALVGGGVSGLAGLAGSPPATMEATLDSCARCHGGDGRGPVSPMVPSLAGQSAPYLASALKEYRDGARPSGMMQPVVANLDDDRIAALAAHYASLDRTAGPPPDDDTDERRRGETIATLGIAGQRIPPCLACHGEASRDVFPRLDGLSAEYIATQLELFRSGVRSGTPKARIMMAIADRLEDSEIAAVAAYFAGRTATSRDLKATGAGR